MPELLTPSSNPPSGAGELARGLAAILGLLLIVAGVAGWSWKGALVLAGAMLFAWAFVTSTKPKERKAE